MRGLPSGTATLLMPARGRPVRRGGIQFGLLHDVEDIEDVATAEWIRWCRARIGRHQVWLFGARRCQRRYVAIPASTTATPA